MSLVIYMLREIMEKNINHKKRFPTLDNNEPYYPINDT